MKLLSAIGDLFTEAAKEADQKNENPMAPPGWAIDDKGQTKSIEEVETEKRREQEKRKDKETLQSADGKENENPGGNPKGWATSKNEKVVARVFQREGKLVGSKVLLRDVETRSFISGIVEADGAGEFGVRWEDDELTLEPKANFELIPAE